MFRTFVPSLRIFSIAIAFIAIVVSRPVLAAADYPVFDRASLTANLEQGSIHVISGDAESYTAIREKSLHYRVRVHLKLTRGRLRSYTISPVGIASAEDGLDVRVQARGLSDVRETHALQVPLRQANGIRRHVIAQCNNLLARGADDTQRHEISVALPVKLSAVAARRGEDGGRNRRVLEIAASVKAQVVCLPLRRARPAAVTEVFLDAPERAGKFCPQDVTLKAWVFSDRPGEFSYRVVGEDRPPSRRYKIRTKRHKDGQVFAQARYTFTTTRPVDERFRIVLDGQQVRSPWLRVSVPCRHKPQPAAFVIEDSTVRVKQSGINRCPQTVTLTARVRTNRPGQVRFRFEEGNGRTTQTFTANSVKRANGRFVAVYDHQVRFQKSRDKKYRLLVNDFPHASQWRPVQVRCEAPPVPFKVTAMALVADIDKGNHCPRNGVLKGWFHTNKPGPVRFHLAWANGRQSKSIALKSVREADGRFVARFRRPIRFPSPVNWRLRSELEGQKLASDWIAVQIRCGGHKAPKQWQSWLEQWLRKLEKKILEGQSQ